MSISRSFGISGFGDGTVPVPSAERGEDNSSVSFADSSFYTKEPFAGERADDIRPYGKEVELDEAG